MTISVEHLTSNIVIRLLGSMTLVGSSRILGSNYIVSLVHERDYFG